MNIIRLIRDASEKHIQALAANPRPRNIYVASQQSYGAGMKAGIELAAKLLEANDKVEKKRSCIEYLETKASQAL